ncbi:hypothetical protein C0431_12255 [bacterium]|nr:hypothetical protein [bacterium]
MDVLAGGIADKAKMQAMENEKRMGDKAEGRFKDVAQRLAYLEGQASGLLVEIIRQSDMSLSTNQGLMVQGGKITLNQTATGYVRNGEAETEILDLGDGVQDVLNIIVAEEKKSGESISVEASYSADGITFTTFMPLPLNAMPKVRFWKFKVMLGVAAAADQLTTRTMDQLPGLIEPGKSVFDGGLLKSENKEDLPLTGDVFQEGMLYSVTFDKPTLGQIGKVSFKEG